MGRIDTWSQQEVGWQAQGSELRIAQQANYANVLYITLADISQWDSFSLGGATAMMSVIKGFFFDQAARLNTLQGWYRASIAAGTANLIKFEVGGATAFNTARLLIWGSAF